MQFITQSRKRARTKFEIRKRYANLLIILVSYFYACNITISPKTTQGKIGDTINFKVVVKNIHLPCLLAMGASEFKFDKVSLLKETSWDTINSVTFEKSITVRLNYQGKGEIVISRVCPIRTSEVKATIEIKGNDQADELSLVLKEIKKWLLNLSKGDTLSLRNLKSLREWLFANSATYLPKTNQTEVEKKIEQFLAQLDKVLAISDSLKKAASEAINQIPNSNFH